MPSRSALRSVVALIITVQVRGAAQEESPAAVPTPGQPAPDIKLARLLNAPEGTGFSWEALRGKVVVLEFWGTYCAPCVSNIPDMNKLEAAFANDPVVFIHVTDEDETTVRKFLEATPICGWVGIDRDHATLKGYGVRGLPQSAVVGKDGRFLGWTRPFRLVNEPEILRQVLQTGFSPELRPSQPSPPDLLRGIPRAAQETDPKNPLCDIVIRGSTPESSKAFSTGGSRGEWRFNKTLAEHISIFWDVSRPRVIAEISLPEETYDIVALNKKANAAEFRDVVRRLIEVTFGISLTREKRVMEALVLRPVPGREPQLEWSPGEAYIDETAGLFAPTKAVLERMKTGEHFFVFRGTVTMLADGISAEANKPVVAELGDLPEKYEDIYTICFPYDKGSVPSFVAELERHVGFTLASDKRELAVLVVRKADHEEPTSGRP